MTNQTGVATADKDLRSLVAGYKDQFAAALPKHLTPDRFIRIVLTAITKTPKLASCTRESVMACLLDCSQLGIEPDGRKAHLIPYGDKCTLIIDYKGLVDLARRSGEIADVHADVVYENDAFEYEYGTNAKLIHKPSLSKREQVIAAYSCVKLKDGSTSFEVMTRFEIDGIKKRSKASGSGPWVTDFNEMAKKTVFRRHSKWLPVSSEFQEAIDKDFDTPDFKGQIIDTASLMPKEITAPAADPEQDIVRISLNQAMDFTAYATGNGYKVEDVEKIIGKKISDLTPAELDAAIAKFQQKAAR